MITITPEQMTHIRNQMHCDIVQEATVRNCINGNDYEGILLLNTPIVFPDKTISGVCCNTGLLLSPEDKVVPYQTLCMRELDKVHTVVANLKQYSFKPDNPSV